MVDKEIAAMDAPRSKEFLLARHEGRVLEWIARRLPARVMPDHMTVLGVGLAIVVAYLVLSINTYLETYAFGVFTLGYGRLGPTEARLGLILLNTLIALGVGLGFEIGGLGLTVLDVIGLGIAGLMAAGLASRAARNLRVLAAQEPAGGVSR